MQQDTPTPSRIQPGLPAATRGRAILRHQLAVWRGLLPAVRRGKDPEALHEFRVAGRRLIGVLRVLEAVPVPGAVGLRHRVRMLVRHGSVARDLDVQRALLEAAFGPGGMASFAALRRRLAWRRLGAHACLLLELRSGCTRSLFGDLDRLARQRSDGNGHSTMASMARAVIERRQHRAARAARRLGGDPSLEACHALRLEAKKLRYVAEPFEPLYGASLRDYLATLQRLQAVLGRINDARNTLREIERLAPADRVAMDRAAKRLKAGLREARAQLGMAPRRIAGRRWYALRERMEAVSAGER